VGYSVAYHATAISQTATITNEYINKILPWSITCRGKLISGNLAPAAALPWQRKCGDTSVQETASHMFESFRRRGQQEMLDLKKMAAMFNGSNVCVKYT
jgi:hypothetical protein